ncbi:MAG: complex I NDUFA9 subunit family protein [Steroidobacteraceae bacterium]
MRSIAANVHDALVLRREFAGADVAINLVGILNEPGRSGAGFTAAHATLTESVVAAAAARGVGKLLQMSSLGADAGAGPSHYLRSKGVAEQHVRAAPMRWTIFRPSVIFGTGDSLLNRFAGLLRLSGGVMPLARAGTRFAPVHVGDVVEAFLRCLPGASHGELSDGESYDLCGPEILTLAELVRRTADAIGVQARILPLPDALARVQAAVMDFLPGKPFSTDNYRSLLRDSVCTDCGLAKLGVTPTSLAAVVPSYLGPAAHSNVRRSASGLRARSRTR